MPLGEPGIYLAIGISRTSACPFAASVAVYMPLHMSRQGDPASEGSPCCCPWRMAAHKLSGSWKSGRRRVARADFKRRVSIRAGCAGHFMLAGESQRPVVEPCHKPRALKVSIASTCGRIESQIGGFPMSTAHSIERMRNADKSPLIAQASIASWEARPRGTSSETKIASSSPTRS